MRPVASGAQDAAAQPRGDVEYWDLVAQGFKELWPILRCYVVKALKDYYGADK